ncbi:ABC transporter permease and substrate binding protein [Leuconostoc kimchii IMSNU 11154]|uniref:ABC transporter permease and substrate binding protein n=1 Tax=Leuconostoc kimchii (strain IMSNU 11154 / KCTC 2386 / IH25) TaxID=762051 RepID=D5T203_LEUKI|nr:FtsX-like permease family protein [Leuconostoc kimchii]ADG40302.1 ABC transporter permease and substrate binding protein [Leuconostoc kimchii IMSNU 11154]
MFYLKLAQRNIRKSFKNFAPFLLATVMMFVLNFILASIAFSPELDKLDIKSVAVVLIIGQIILIPFSIGIEIYAYRFLLKKRSREFGLYDILGLGKMQIIVVALLELFILLVVTLLLGTIVGVILSKFLFLVFIALIGGNYFNLTFSMLSVSMPVIVTVIAFVLLASISMWTIHHHSSLTLLHSENQGEREPKSRGFLAFLGMLLLVIGYYLAITIKVNSLIIVIFAGAVLLVIAGTYLFYVAMTIWYLKRQKHGRKYYQPEKFITTNALLYRMKQNAIGLGNITILVTMAIVTLVTTVMLQAGLKQNMMANMPFTTELSAMNTGDTRAGHVTQGQFDRILALTEQQTQVDLKKGIQYVDYGTTSVKLTRGKHVTVKHIMSSDSQSGVTNVQLVSRDTLIKLGNKLPKLAPNDILIHNYAGEFNPKTINWFGQLLRIKGQTAHVKNYATQSLVGNSTMIVTANDTQTKRLYQRMTFDADGYSIAQRKLVIDLSKNDSQKVVKAFKSVNENDNVAPVSLLASDRVSLLKEGQAYSGGFLFIGFTLGLTFIIGAALIIYYKQIAEGEQDKEAFRILQEVGLSKREVSQTINSQIRLLFFMPIVVAVVHFAGAYMMITKIINAFGINNNALMLSVSGGVILLIISLYYLIYKLTSRSYVNIVQRHV